MHLEQEIPVDRAHQAGWTHESPMMRGHFHPGQLGLGEEGVGPLGLMVQEVDHGGGGNAPENVFHIHTEALQILQGEVDPPHRAILGDIAENIGELEGDAELVGVLFDGPALGSEDRGAAQSHGGGDATAINLEFPECRVAVLLRLPGIHQHSPDDFREELPVQLSPLDHVMKVLGKPRSTLDRRQPRFKGIQFQGGLQGAVVGDVIDQTAPCREEKGVAPPVRRQKEQRRGQV